jgi:hypothetical protein
VSIGVPVPVPVPRDSSIHDNPPQSTTHRSHQVQQSRAKIAMQFILTIKVNAIGTAKTMVLLFCVSTCAHQPSTLTLLRP